MDAKDHAWNTFVNTGRVEDYLHYIKARNAVGWTETGWPELGEDVTPDEAHDRWDRGQYGQY